MTTMDKVRSWSGAALFSYGFRPFFLGGAVHAVLMIAVWVPWYLGAISLPSAFDPTVWHAHELLFGYVPAIVAGFLLTAVPNWTGRLPVTGGPLAGLFAVWLAGRVAVAVSAAIGQAAALASLAFPLILVAVIARELLHARNRSNLTVLLPVSVLAAAQVWFHWEIWHTGRPVFGTSAAVAAIITLIIIIGGRIVPSFTANWLRGAGAGAAGRQPVPFNLFDRVTIVFSAAAFAAWVAAAAAPAPFRPTIAGLLILAGLLNLWRMVRWAPERTGREPLVAVLHAGYAFVPLGFLFAGAAVAGDDGGLTSAALHTWTVGAIGLMTLAVMTRATRGHSGRPLTAPPGTVAIYLAMIAATGTRVAAAILPEHLVALLTVAGITWVAAFGGFIALYGPMLLTRRVRPPGA